MLMAFGLRHVVGSRAFKDQRNFRLHVVNRRLCAAQAKLLLHGEHGIKIAIIAVFQQLQRNCTTHAVVERLRFHFILAVALPFRCEGNVIAGVHIFERVGLVLRADVNEQLVVAEHMGKFLPGLQMDGL